MNARIAYGAARAASALFALVVATPAVRADSLVETSMEHRFQIDFHVPDAALKALLPAGWSPVVAPAGAAKDANIRMIFVDRIAVFGADGKPAGKSWKPFVYLAVPAKQSGAEGSGQMIVRGIGDGLEAEPAMAGVFAPATRAQMHVSVETQGGPATGEEDWTFAAADGEHMEAHIVYERANGNHSAATTKVYSAHDPASFEIWKTDQSLDIMRNATIDVGARVKSFSYKAGGGAIASLFDGTEKVLSLDSPAVYSRVVTKP